MMDVGRADTVFRKILSAYKDGQYDSIPGRKVKPITLLDCAFDKVIDKEGYLHWVLSSIHQERYSKDLPVDTTLFDNLERDIQSLQPSLIATALYLVNSFVTASKYLSISLPSQRIANRTIIAVRAKGGRTFQNDSGKSPDPPSLGTEDNEAKPRSLKVTELCLERDDHRCVISKVLDRKKGSLTEVSYHVEVAHIIPFCISEPSSDMPVIRLFRFNGNYNNANHESARNWCRSLFENVQLDG